MRLRKTYLVGAPGAGQALTDTQTFTFSLVGVGKIRSLRVHYEATNGATSNTVGNLHSMVSKLQVLDGSRVLHSCSMAEEIALNCHMRGSMPHQYLTQAAAGVVAEDVFIDFSTGPGDRVHYLDTANYKSPQISFTHAMTISATAGFATGTTNLMVEAEIIDDSAPANQGFIMSKEVFSFASAASGNTPELLQLDYPYAALLVFAPKAATAPDTIITQIGLGINANAIVPFLRYTTDIERELVSLRQPFTQRMIPLAGGTSNTLNFDLYHDTAPFMAEAGATSLGVVGSVAANQVGVIKTTGGTAEEMVGLTGYLPAAGWYLPFGDGKTPDDFLNPANFNSMQLTLTNGATGSTVTGVTQQLAPM